jgi:integrase
MAKLRGDMRYLVQHNGHPTWHCVKDVPVKLRSALGKARLVKSLQTHDIAVARARRWEALAEFEQVLTSARDVTGPSRAVDAGMAWRHTLQRIASGDPATLAAHLKRRPETGDTPVEQARSNADEEIDWAGEDFHEDDRATFHQVAYGRATPLLHHVDAWLTEGGPKGRLNPRTAGQYRHDVGRLATWARAAKLPETVETFTRAIAGRYVTETMVRPKINPSTANRWISAASAYWRWMSKRAGMDVNPWQNQSLAKAPSRSGGERDKRPATDDEMRLLLDGSPGQELADLIRVAALSGMRLEEVYRLTVKDCDGGWFNVRVSKTPAGVRRVPTHSELAAIVARRCKDKQPTDYLFHEAGPAKEGRERSMAISKRFGRYRQVQGVHDAKEGRRASAVDFHSLRRWFITTARNAHQDRAMVAAVVGHEAGNITDDVYSSGPSDALRRAVVEAVQLPAT